MHHQSCSFSGMYFPITLNNMFDC